MQELNHFQAWANTQTVGQSPGAALWRRLWREEEGQGLVEYGLLVGLLALVAVAAMTLFGRRMNNNLYGTSNNVLPFGN